jgi:Family of unknown function (DUF6009)
MKLEWEKQIVWLDQPERYRYLRETIVETPFRTRKPRDGRCPGRIVAYATLKDDAPSESPSSFMRRVWYVAPHDPYNDGGTPMEAVDPHFIQPGWSELSPESNVHLSEEWVM